MRSLIGPYIVSALLSLIVATFVTYFANFNFQYFFYFILILLAINLVFAIQRWLFFFLLAFFLLYSFYPILTSLIQCFSPQYHSGVDFFFTAFLSLLFVKLISSSRIKIIRIVIASIISIFIFEMFKYVLQYENYLKFITIFSTSAIFISLTLNKPIIYGRSRLLNSTAIFAIGLFLFIYPLQFDKPKLNIGLLESKWCSTIGSFTDDYSMKSAYSYSLMKRVISERHNLSWIQEHSDLETALPTINILIVTTPLKPFTKEQISAVEKFVTRGGKLIAIADHTDLYGHATVLNQLLYPFDVAINNVSLFKLNFKDSDIEIKGIDSIDRIKIKTPSSLSLYRPSFVWAWATEWISEKGDYSKPNFFGDLTWTADDIVGKWAVGASIKHHKGEVVVFCDSTVFANFCLFQPNYLGLLDRIISDIPIASNSFYYGCMVTIIISFIVLFYRLKDVSINLALIFLIILSSTYYKFIPHTQEYFQDDTRLDVYCDPQLILEDSPKAIPNDSSFSTAYSNIARSGKDPFYRGESPPKELQHPSLWITTYHNFIANSSFHRPDNLKIVILDQIPNDNIFNVSNKLFNYERTLIFEEAVGILPTIRNYSEKDGRYTTDYNNFSILFSYGILNDQFTGNWWVNNDISPYRRFIFSSFYNWLNKNEPIREYSYPKIGITNTGSNRHFWHFKTDAGKDSRLPVEIIPNLDSFVYFGSGVWGIYSQTSNGEFILGGPEMSDDLLATSMNIWAARKEATTE
jgi:hypothetical protein